MNDPNPWTLAAYPGDALAHLRWWCDVSKQAGRELAVVLAELDRLQAELAEQKRLNVKLAERLAACSECLGRAAGRGKVCQCSVPEVVQ